MTQQDQKLGKHHPAYIPLLGHPQDLKIKLTIGEIPGQSQLQIPI